jgi:hypothetical protein
MRQTARATAREIGILRSTLSKMLLANTYIRRHSAAVTPKLTPLNRLHQLYYAKNKIRKHNNQLHYDAGYDIIHANEKWFYLSKTSNWYYLTEDEEGLIHHTRNKGHILKIMFLCVVSRPRFGADGNCTFDGKIGVWPFVEFVQAWCSSKNRPRGTWETKPVNVNYDIY